LISNPKLKALGDSGRRALGGGREGGGGVTGEVVVVEGMEGTGENRRGSWTMDSPFGSVKDSEGLTRCLGARDDGQEETSNDGAGA
jgi:hypothetical protein